MERALGLIGGAGILPARMAAEARRQGWRVVAFAYAELSGVAPHAARIVPSRLTEPEAVLAVLHEEGVRAAVFGGTFDLQGVLKGDLGSEGGTYARSVRGASSLRGAELFGLVARVLESVGIEVLDQRTFLGPWLDPAGCWSRREPTAEEWRDIRQGLALGRTLAAHGVGQTLVVRRGVVAAVEAVEGTTAAIRRGTALAGPGAVVVKAVGPGHDYRFDTPVIGPESVEAAVDGCAAVVAVEAGRVLTLDRPALVARADAAGLGLIGVGDDGAGAA